MLHLSLVLNSVWDSLSYCIYMDPHFVFYFFQILTSRWSVTLHNKCGIPVFCSYLLECRDNLIINIQYFSFCGMFFKSRSTLSQNFFTRSLSVSLA